MKIFIGSSTKRKGLAEKVAKALERAQFTVFRWWDQRVLRGGDVTIDRLVRMSDICDGAVFIFGKDDKLVVEKDGNVTELMATKDNVILEYGIFVGKYGRERTLFVTEEDVKIPTDLNGVTYLNQSGFETRVADRFREVFKEHRSPESYGYSTFLINRDLLRSLESGGEASWVSRLLYTGTRGAKAWKDVEASPQYSGTRDFKVVQKLIKRLVDDSKIPKSDYVISLGPGLGELDKGIVPYLKNDDLLWYIPVDINPYLANYAAKNLDASSKQVLVPFCIVGDFEDKMSRVADIIEHKTSPNRAFVMLGGTFGNLEKGETPFLNGLHDCMHVDDIAILDIFTAGKEYTFDKDALFHLDTQPDAVKRFLAGGIRRNGQVSVDDIVRDISQHIGTKKRPTDDASDISGTYTFEFHCVQTSKPLIFVRRYDCSEFKTHIEQLGFKVIASGSTGDDQSIVRRSVFILRKS